MAAAEGARRVRCSTPQGERCSSSPLASWLLPPVRLVLLPPLLCLGAVFALAFLWHPKFRRLRAPALCASLLHPTLRWDGAVPSIIFDYRGNYHHYRACLPPTCGTSAVEIPSVMEAAPSVPRCSRRSRNHLTALPVLYPSYDAPSASVEEALARIASRKRYRDQFCPLVPSVLAKKTVTFTD